MSLPNEKEVAFVFGDIIDNGWASERNPHRKGTFISYVGEGSKKRIRLTDMRGNFWETYHDKEHKNKKIGTIFDTRPIPAQDKGLVIDWEKNFYKEFTNSYPGDSGIGGNDPQDPSCDWACYPDDVVKFIRQLIWRPTVNVPKENEYKANFCFGKDNAFDDLMYEFANAKTEEFRQSVYNEIKLNFALYRIK